MRVGFIARLIGNGHQNLNQVAGPQSTIDRGVGVGRDSDRHLIGSKAKLVRHLRSREYLRGVDRLAKLAPDQRFEHLRR